ncbi:MAG: type I-U CRISPR-associated RAMP protein Csb1/Cas7u [Armatimonadota bacterium]|nr:type I-U CRISPR-associated RAMP protein Csb1/Cas7u [Armatimonadota bacterium]
MSLLQSDSARILIEADLWPVQGERFQPTGFPDLGPAVYRLPDGTQKLLVESTQSMANRLEAVCWDEASQDLVPELQGLPYVRIKLGSFGITSSILEFHRLNSPYIWELEGDDYRQRFQQAVYRELGVEGRRPTRRRRSGGEQRQEEQAELPGGEQRQEEQAELPGVVDPRRLARLCLRYDPNSIVHGVFLEKIAGRFRLPRVLSAFIEAADVAPAESGGVKFDRVFPSADRARGIQSDQGFTNVPFARTEFTARTITAYFNLDLALLRSYGLPAEGEQLVRALALWKVRRFLDGGLRLRTACDLECREVRVTRPVGDSLPTGPELDKAVREAIDACRRAGHFADPPVTEFETRVPERPGRAAGPTAEEEGEEEGEES